MVCESEVEEGIMGIKDGPGCDPDHPKKKTRKKSAKKGKRKASKSRKKK